MRLQERSKKPKNVIALKSVVERDTIDVIELEYIKGRVLDDILNEQTRLPSTKIVQYGAGILNGLIEMHEVGIYHHRDIRPANIMVDADSDEAVIVDLGIATTEENAKPLDNYRFGGQNDLVSLGQVMYFMSTGHHLFSKSDSMHVTRFKRNLRDEREKAYTGTISGGLKAYLEKIEDTIRPENSKKAIKAKLTHSGTFEVFLERVGDNVESRNLRMLIKTCLTTQGKDKDYQMLTEMFEAYTV